MKLNQTTISALAIAVLFGVPLASNADFVYTYTGNDFSSVDNGIPGVIYTTSMNVTATVDYSSPLGANLENVESGLNLVPASFTLSDGLQTFTDATPGVGSVFYFDTDGNGNITSWYIAASIPGGNSIGGYDRFSATQTNDYGEQFSILSGTELAQSGAGVDSPGVWNVAVVPEPAIYWQLGAGLAALGLVRRPRMRNATTGKRPPPFSGFSDS
jgi:hypothetical protein